MNCIDAQERFAELLDGELDEPAHRALKAHLASCPECSAEHGYLGVAVAGIAALPVMGAPAGFADAVMGGLGAAPSLFERLLHGWKKWALGVAGAGAIATGMAMHDSKPPAASPTARPSIAAPAAPGESGSAATFPLATGPVATAAAGPVTTDAAVADGTGTAADGAENGIASASAGRAAGPAASATATPATERANSPAANRSAPSISGPHTEESPRARDGRPLEVAPAGQDLDRPLSGQN